MVEWLEHLTLVRKVSGSNPTRAEAGTHSLSPSSKRVPDYYHRGRFKGGKRRGLGTIFHMQ